MTALGISELHPKSNFNSFVWQKKITFDQEVKQLVGSNDLWNFLQDKDLEDKLQIKSK